MMTRYIMCIVFIYTLLYVKPIHGQRKENSTYNIIHYNSNDGLPQNSITFIQFDKAGFCWLGTEMGLVRFDGRNFKIFNSDDIKGLHSDRMRVSRKDANGTLYFKNSDFELLSLKYNSYNVAPSPILNNDLSIRLPSIAGCATRSVHTGTLSLQKSKFSFPKDEIITSSGQHYILQRKRLYYLQDLQDDKAVLIDSNAVRFINNCLVFKDLVIFFDKGGKFRAYRDGKPAGPFFIDNTLLQNEDFLAGDFTCFTDNNDGENFLYAGQTLYRVDVHGRSITGHVALKNIDVPVISAVAYNSELNKYFIGSLTSGLFIVSPSDFYYPPYPATAEKDGFFAQAITNDSSGIISQRYLYHKDGTHKLLPVSPHLEQNTLLVSRNNLYYGDDPFLLKLDLSTNHIDTILSLNSRPSVIMRDKYDSSCLLVSTAFSIYKLKNNHLVSRTEIPCLRQKGYITEVEQIGKDTFIIATKNGLVWFDNNKKHIFRSALDTLYVRNIYAENRNRIWVSSYDQGFYLIDSGRATRMPFGPADALKTVHAFIDAGRDIFWLPTNNGLYMVNKSSLLRYAHHLADNVYFYSFTTANSLHTNEFNGGCFPPYVWMKDSMLSLPSLKGLVWFYPNKVHIQYPNNDIYIDFLTLNNKRLDVPVDRKLLVNADFTNMTVAISCPYFGNKENLKLYYNIQGLDSVWNPVSDNGLIQINRIPPGSYSIVIRKDMPDKNAADTFESIHIVVKKPVYQTPLFIGSAAFVICAIIFLVYYARIRLLKHRNEVLQHIISAQTKNLENSVKELRRSKEQLERTVNIKDNIITFLLHDLRSPIYSLNRISGNAVIKYDEYPVEINKKNLLEIYKAALNLFNFTQNFFTWAITQKENFKPSLRSVSLQTVFNDVKKLYVDIAQIHNNTLNVAPTKISCICDKDILFAIIRNLIDNATKNTHNGNIYLYADREEDAISIVVADTGKGLSKEQIDNFFDTDRENAYSKNGSRIIMELARAINSRISIESAPNAGARFIIRLNVLNEYPS